MRRRFLLVFLFFGMAIGLAVHTWPLNLSELFYLFLPVVVLSLFVLSSRLGLIELRPQLLRALGYLAILVFVLAAFSYSMVRGLVPEASGMFWSFAWLNPWELLVGVYFLVGVSLILGGMLHVCSALARWVDMRFFQPLADMPKTSKTRGVLVGLASRLLLLVLALPYLEATLFVNRFKMPNPWTPRDLIGRDFEDVEFTTADHLQIRGWFLPTRTGASDRTLLICHGLGANRSNFLPFVEVGNILDANVLLFDFRGHGDSEGHTVSAGYWEKLDVLTAVEYLRTKRPTQARELYAVGISMGSAALIRAAAELNPPLDALIIDSAFTNAVELTDSILRPFPSYVRPLITKPGIPLACLLAGCWIPDVRPIDVIARVRATLLIIHAEGDPMIASDHARRLYDAAVEPKTLWIADTQGHGSALILAGNEYRTMVKEWMARR